MYHILLDCLMNTYRTHSMLIKIATEQIRPLVEDMLVFDYTA